MFVKYFILSFLLAVVATPLYFCFKIEKSPSRTLDGYDYFFFGCIIFGPPTLLISKIYLDMPIRGFFNRKHFLLFERVKTFVKKAGNVGNDIENRDVDERKSLDKELNEINHEYFKLYGKFLIPFKIKETSYYGRKIEWSAFESKYIPFRYINKDSISHIVMRFDEIAKSISLATSKKYRSFRNKIGGLNSKCSCSSRGYVLKLTIIELILLNIECFSFGNKEYSLQVLINILSNCVDVINPFLYKEMNFPITLKGIVFYLDKIEMRLIAFGEEISLRVCIQERYPHNFHLELNTYPLALEKWYFSNKERISLMNVDISKMKYLSFIEKNILLQKY